MTLAELDAMYRDSLTSCYNHLTKPYNLQWDGTTAKWNGSPNADFYSVIIYAVSGTESKPVYKKIRYELVSPEQTQMDCGNIFTVDGKYAFAVRSETNEDGKIKGFISSGISEYSPIYTVGEAQKPDTDRKDWIPISTAKEWIELANIEDVPAENGSNISKQAVEWGKKYYLTDDIDFSELSAADQAKTKSIGNVNNRFMGTMDGNGFKIKGLTLSNNDAGLFSDIGATGLVCDMTIENANVLFSDNAAVLALNNRGTITDCAVKNCNVTADTGAVLGGMVSRNYGKISKCYVEGGSLVSNSKTATGHAGFVGSNEGTGLIESCWTSMNINTQSDYAGGFIGLGYGGTVRNCFALGAVSAGGYSGGFAGRSVYQGNIYENCYAAGKVTVTGEEGNGFIGGNKPNSAFQYDQSEGVTNCYYNAENKDCRPYGAQGRTTDEMKTADFLKVLSAGSSAWLQNEGKNDGLPYLNGVKAPEGTAAGDITVEIAVAKYNKSTYNFEKMGEPVSVTMSSNGNTRVVDLMDEAVKQNKMTYSYKTSSAFGRYIHTINGRAVEAPDGWMFTVNDKLSNVSASIATVKDGDKLLWYEGTTENLFKGPLWGDLGTGKEENWVDINTVEDLQKLANTKDGKELAKNYRLGRSLDLNGIEIDGIGSVSAPFTGVFDGQNHVISNVKISRSDDCTGFFNAIKGATVKNLKLKGANISGTSRVGGLVGYAMVELDKNNMSGNEANLIGNCTVTGKVTGTADKNTNTGSTGGLVGENGGAYDKDTLFSIYSAVDKCHADVEVTGKYKTGGLIGDNKGNVTKSYALGNVTGTTTTGGFVGDNDGNIYDCHSEGAVNGNGHTGGFAGYSAGEIKTAYSLGNVTGSEYTGGFAGAVSKADFVISAGTVTVTGQSSAGYNGGFAGVLGGTLAGPENMVTIKDAYGNCTGIDSVIGNSTKFEGETEKEKLSQMKLPDMKATAEKLYEMFGINLPSDLSGEAEKYLDAYAVPTGTEAEGTVSPLKKM